MGDRCYFSVTVRKSDVIRFTEIMDGRTKGSLEGKSVGDLEGLDWEDIEEDDDGVTLIDYSANYGYYDQTREAAQEGLVFIGYSGAGDGYCGREFVGVGYQIYDIIAVQDVGTVVPIGKEGVSARDKKDAKAYYAALERARELMARK